MADASPRTKGARRCTNPECEYGGLWVGRMVVLRNGRFLFRGRGCHIVYDAREVIAPENGTYLQRMPSCWSFRGELHRLISMIVAGSGGTDIRLLEDELVHAGDCLRARSPELDRDQLPACRLSTMRAHFVPHQRHCVHCPQRPLERRLVDRMAPAFDPRDLCVAGPHAASELALADAELSPAMNDEFGGRGG
jgi:hypothetical protein